MVLILLEDKISKALENEDFVFDLYVYVVLLKVFDSVNYHILFAKWYHHGIWGCLHDWFKSYLSDRKHYV